MIASGFSVLIYCVVVIFVAVVIKWLLGVAGYPPSAEVEKWGKILVAVLCLAAIILWLLSLIGVAPYYGPHFFR